ncbi:MAG: hypothetical protein L0219_14495, partial [Phycisphaerales bacterium]|nr:hypothetical protein [Phycisphaerales bacterium]
MELLYMKNVSWTRGSVRACRTKNLIEAIRAHSSEGSEANRVVSNYFDLSELQKQDFSTFSAPFDQA